MCGGEGSRLESPVEKPLFEIGGVTMIDRVLEALRESQVETVVAAVSPNAPDTRAHLLENESPAGLEVEVLETRGEGYVADLQSILESPSNSLSTPVLTVAADLPLLEGAVIDTVLERYRRRTRTETTADGEANRSLTVCVPVAMKRRLGFGVGTTLPERPHLAPTGVNIVGESTQPMTEMITDWRLASNVNRRSEARAAATLLARFEGGPTGTDRTLEDGSSSRRSLGDGTDSERVLGDEPTTETTPTSEGDRCE